MASKKTVRAAAPAVAATIPQPSSLVSDILLDWRFNLIVIVSMEILLILFALPREIERYRIAAAQKALLRGDYQRAYSLYYALEKRDKSNPGYLKALGDIALARLQFSRALEYYQRASTAGYAAPDLKLHVARTYYELAQRETDPKRQNEYVDGCRKLLQSAREEAPNDLAVNYWLGWFALNAQDLVEAADFFSRVRPEALPRGWKPTPVQQDLIKKAQQELARIRAAIFEGKDFPLDLTGLEILTTPTLPTAQPIPPPKAAATPTTPPAAAAPAAPGITTGPSGGAPAPTALPAPAAQPTSPAAKP
ncbi:MAG: hypothetical protein N3D11_08955 [Candidatus Sumerlaeia bacterium]|nr:hypothetical protein [Candidatus Sumerlaeia bacterium]